jgi:hypothetical protein
VSRNPGRTYNPGKTYKVTGTIKQGIDGENAKKIIKLIRDEGPKTVETQIRATRSASAARNATTCRRSSPCSRRPTSTSRCSSSTTAEHRPDWGRPLQNPHVM